ncbi:MULTISPECIES: hypothetical protein [Enterobacter]|uniref:hypothetical protein n=1 Tax=Enterobacter TaxID=547 RepID=UPI0006DACF9F|nr:MULTISPECIES: hypothetical protein [Enterobacter]HCR2015094.1 hypothetical protein [Enterobacter asburiae]HDU8903119.1 hypothetical protein [Enterobacter ludwigii]HDZ0517924.1 hypothetical protein [Klebsiella pneumoniae]KTG90840.1 hypothetical protein ASV36_11980 [Enterobacter hormaechei subsp. steigerwaltii]KVJ99845.1 hypothetical protein AWS22_17320 [Enterobacter hormaechei subsp. steigerwaltii]
MSASQQPLERTYISDVKVNTLFSVISDQFGYDAKDWAKEIVALMNLWKKNGFIEVYQTKEDRKFGLIKDSSINERGIISPYYIGLFHARLIDGDNDPLIIIKFHEVEGDHPYADMKFMLDHCDIFGDKSQKFDQAQMRFIWKQIDEFIQQADGTL